VITQRPIRRPIILRARALVAAAAVASAAGCSGGGSGSESTSATSGTTTTPPTTTTSATQSPTSTPTASVAAPVLPEAAKHPTVAGADAFFRYFIETYNYAFAALDVRPMQAICDPTSKFCTSVYSEVSVMASSGQHHTGGVVTVTDVIPGPLTSNLVTLLDALTNQTEGQTRDVAGQTVNTAKSRNAIATKAVLQWKSGMWRAMGIEVKK
jgi:Family of unknown function (DUF6318)